MLADRKGLASRDLDRLFRRGAVPAGDGALLDDFLAGGDESAFDAIVARHGPMVLGVCRRLLGDPHDADDAFQATFLVLVRRARQIRDGDRLGPWLYGVATRVATKARARDARRKSRPAGPDDLAATPAAGSEWLDLRPILDAELGRLPAKLRDVLVLCLLEGATAEEAARRLSCPLGTAKSRLARGREALRSRLVVRGIAPALALAAAVAPRPAFASPVSQALSRMTLGMLGLSPDRLPPGVVALTRGVAPTMLRTARLLAAVACGGLALAGIGLSARAKPDAAADQAPAPDDPDGFRAVSIDHFKMVMLALHNYNNINGRFPPAAIVGKDGKPLLSWRVAVLPYLDAVALYDEFHLDEPWDSPHNKPLIARMPEVFATPSSPTAPGTTRIRGFVGPNAMFEENRGVALPDIIDGTSNTVMIAAGRQAVPWTKPDELPFAAGKPLPALDQGDDKGVLVGIGDGSVRYVPAGDQALLQKILTRDGNEVVAWPPAPRVRRAEDQPAITAPAPRPTPPPTMPGAGPTPPTPAPAAPIPPELDRRLRGIEDKLDRLLRKLDAPDAPR